MAFYDYYLMVAELIAEVRCAHTYAIPIKNIQSLFNTVKTFPLMIFFMEGKYYVTINGTKDQTIKPGFEVLSINGKSVHEIRARIKKYLWADGFNEPFKNKAMNEMYFALFYYLLVEKAQSFDLVLKNGQDEEIKMTVAAQRYAETVKNFKNPVNKKILSIAMPRNKLDAKKGWRMNIRKEENVAVMRISGFGGGRNEEEARRNMRTFMDNCMKQLQEKKVNDLIIDLRYNGGGWDIQGVELFTYFIKQPTRAYRRLHSITDSSEFLQFSDLSEVDRKNVKQELRKESDGTFSVKEEYSQQLQLQQPKPNGFRGNVYILSDGASASTTSEFIAYTKSSGLATIIGEESGGAYEGGNGGSFLHFELPSSKIAFGTPLLYYDNEVKPVEVKGRGTMPDYAVPYNIEHLLKGYDTQLNFALELIRKSREKK